MITKINDNLLRGVSHELEFFNTLLFHLAVLEEHSSDEDKKNIAEFKNNVIFLVDLIEQKQRVFSEISNYILLKNIDILGEINGIYVNILQTSLSFKIFQLFSYLFSKIGLIKCLKPTLGKLVQYPSRKMMIPDDYVKHIKLMQVPMVSIVTPSFNQAAYIKRTIESVLNQNYHNLEYIVQDGNSTDQTVEILCKYEGMLRWESKKDLGQGNAINLGFMKTSGEIMAYLNSDDILLPGTLNYVVDYFNLHPEIDVVYGHRVIIDENDLEVGRWVLPKHSNEILSWVDYIPQETLFWRRSIWDKIGGAIDENFQFALDWDLLVRFRDAGAKFYRLPRFLGAFRVHESQKTSNAIGKVGLKEMILIRQRCNDHMVSNREIFNHTIFYLMKNSLYNILLKLKLLKY